jgi:hypothetical protein
MSSVRTLLVIAVAFLALGVGSAAQVAVAPQSDIAVHDAAHANLLQARAATAADAFQEQVLVHSSNGAVLTNMNQVTGFTFQGHDLSLAKGGDQAGGTEGGLTILYAPSEADDAAYRAAIGAAAGGATVDYFDTRVATPSVATLNQYDAVHTWTNFAYQNNVLFGDNLAAYNDNGGTVVLGVFCTFTSGNFLSGAIMTSGYNPVVSPLGNNHFTSSTYSAGGVTCIYNGVTSLTSTFRDFLVTQGTGVVDGNYADGEICHAYRSGTSASQGDVIYSNGAGAIQLPGSAGQWGTAVGNACSCGVATTSAWTDEGSALAGAGGDPLLEGVGGMIRNTVQFLHLSNAAASAPSVILASTSSSPVAFKGGTLLPGPSIFAFPLMTNGGGGWSVSFRAPNVPPGSELWVQVGIQDGGAVQGVALSNAVKGTTP